MSTATPVMSRAECRKRLAENLTRIFQERNTTALAAAASAGVCYRVVQRAARGQSDPALSIMFSLAHAMGMKLEDLLAGQDSPKKTKKRA